MHGGPRGRFFEKVVTAVGLWGVELGCNCGFGQMYRCAPRENYWVDLNFFDACGNLLVGLA
jgi:hypothetical protein